nr:hypothetical protein K07C6.15 - Caenorhabditis elegans [Caenorhabditis elegans]
MIVTQFSMAENDQVLLFLAPLSFLGVIVNWLSFISIHRLKVFSHSFGYLSSIQAFAGGFHSTVFLLYFCPMVLLNQPFLKEYSHFCGFVLLFFYELSVSTHLLVSINRLLAVWSPLSYNKIFTLKNTKIMVISLWLYNLVNAYLFYIRLCHFYYKPDAHFLTFTNSPLCDSVGWYVDFLKNSAIVTIFIILDIITLIKVKRTFRHIKHQVNSANALKMSRRDRRFLKQTVIQGSVFLIEILFYFFIPQNFEDRWIVFFGTSFAWVAVPVADGFRTLNFIFVFQGF